MFTLCTTVQLPSVQKDLFVLSACLASRVWNNPQEVCWYADQCCRWGAVFYARGQHDYTVTRRCQCCQDNLLRWRYFEGRANLTATVAEQILHPANPDVTVEKV